MKYLLILLLITQPFFGKAQKEDSLLINVESYLLTKDVELARSEFNKLTNLNTDYLKSLKNLFKKNDSYADVEEVIKNICVRNPTRIEEVHKMFNTRLISPNGKHIDVSYVKCKWALMMALLEGNRLALANEEYLELNEYISTFNVGDVNFKRAIFYKNIYNIVLEIIKQEVDLGVKLSSENMLIAKELQDTNLMVMSDYYYSDFFFLQNDLEGYIDLANHNIQLSLKAKELPDYYYEHQFHLIDALMFKNGAGTEVLNILETLYKNQELTAKTYSYYFQIINKSKLDSEIMRFVMNKFDVNSLPNLCNELISRAEGKVGMNDHRLLYSLAAQILYQHQYYEETFVMMQNQINFVKSIYTNDLAKALALSEIRKVEDQKRFEIELEKQKSEKQNLYLLIVLFVLIITIMVVYYQIRKNRKLVAKNSAIAKSDKEKRLLLKEIHHRVKNNFQIVTSLLQLQIKEIKDPHALDVILEGQKRIKSMALIHQKLYQNKHLSVQFKEYSYCLFKDINVMFSEVKVDVTIDIPDTFELDIDTAIPLGLVLNELITNAFKYAFRSNRDNTFSISLIQGNEANQLFISDNGDGVNTIDMNKENSIGLKLVSDLAKQLHGGVELISSEGNTFVITFKETFQREMTE